MNTFSRVAIALVGMTGLVAAQPKPSEPKPPVAAPAPGAKPADTKVAPPMPKKAPQELTDMAKVASGTWRCKGQGADEKMTMIDMAGTMKVKSALDGFWLQSTFDAKMGKQAYRFESFTTFDAASKKWKRVMVDSSGSWSTGESTGMANNKTDWDLTSHGPMGEMMFRDHEDMTDPKVGLKAWGEMSMDKGKTWMKVYEMTCKK